MDGWLEGWVSSEWGSLSANQSPRQLPKKFLHKRVGTPSFPFPYTCTTRLPIRYRCLCFVISIPWMLAEPPFIMLVGTRSTPIRSTSISRTIKQVRCNVILALHCTYQPASRTLAITKPSAWCRVWQYSRRLWMYGRHSSGDHTRDLPMDWWR